MRAATRLIADAPNTAARGRLIDALKLSELGTPSRALYGEFQATKRTAEASSVFARESGRFPLTSSGDINTYGLFAELFEKLHSSRGLAGIIVPADILSGDTLKEFFKYIVQEGALRGSIAFENEDFIFPGIANVNRFAVIILGPSNPGKKVFPFVFYLRRTDQIADDRRFFNLSEDDFKLLSPNTRTCPVFRSKAYAELTKAIYRRVPVLIDESI